MVLKYFGGQEEKKLLSNESDWDWTRRLESVLCDKE